LLYIYNLVYLLCFLILTLTVCTIPSLNLDCSNHKNVRVTWNDDCVFSCSVIWNCTNGEDVSVEKVYYILVMMKLCVLLVRTSSYLKFLFVL